MKLRQHSLDMIGQDTEFFLWDSKKEEVVPSYKYFKQKSDEEELFPANSPYFCSAFTKSRLVALKPDFSGRSFTDFSGHPVRVFRDGLAVEINSAPATCRAYLWQDNKLALAMAISKLWPKRRPKHLSFTARPVVEVSEALRAQFPKDLRVLGCNPTYDAYKERMKTVLADPMKLPFRTSGAHFHSSFSSRLEEECWGPIAKLADLLMGAPYTYIFGDELEFKRRTLYGQAGEFRFQDYTKDPREPWTGVEYRVLSSRVYNHPGIFGLFSGIWKYVVLSNYSHLWSMWDKSWEPELQEAINVGTPKALEEMLVLGNSLLSKVSTLYSLKWPKEGSKEVPAIWKKLRELNLEGAFPDAGIINHAFPEAHYGWNEYRKSWNI